MDASQRKVILDSLTPEQRKGIAAIIRGVKVQGDWNWNGEDSFFEESTAETIQYLAAIFESYDPNAVID